MVQQSCAPSWRWVSQQAMRLIPVGRDHLTHGVEIIDDGLDALIARAVYPPGDPLHGGKGAGANFKSGPHSPF